MGRGWERGFERGRVGGGDSNLEWTVGLDVAETPGRAQHRGVPLLPPSRPSIHPLSLAFVVGTSLDISLSVVSGSAFLDRREGGRQGKAGAAAEGWVWECLAALRVPIAGGGSAMRREGVHETGNWGKVMGDM